MMDQAMTDEQRAQAQVDALPGKWLLKVSGAHGLEWDGTVMGVGLRLYWWAASGEWTAIGVTVASPPEAIGSAVDALLAFARVMREDAEWREAASAKIERALLEPVCEGRR